MKGTVAKHDLLKKIKLPVFASKAIGSIKDGLPFPLVLIQEDFRKVFFSRRIEEQKCVPLR